MCELLPELHDAAAHDFRRGYAIAGAIIALLLAVELIALALTA
ncbi:MAG TPA: hypothetical protein VK438_05445 [Xanthobacteraceae bacterium]|nr:hypothetical protein [Xanthobacteraceae bacterium]